MQGICDENKQFIDVFIGFPGSTHDSRVLRNSPVFSCIENIPDGIFNFIYVYFVDTEGAPEMHVPVSHPRFMSEYDNLC